MSDYQVIARKFRPQCFKEVMGQDAIVMTLKNAIKFNRLAQAYLFCGSRGTGKTTLARIFAKALNCQHLTSEFEPCNQCSACHEITNGSSLDVLEIDGASNRGIEDIRQINENVGYATSGHYKIYIIDEVHMLTKEAFNALLKTLEEPPPKVKFFFATTEPHKVLPTILSRCQRFNLHRISLDKIQLKLRYIVQKMGIEADEEALFLLAQQAEGGLRDAESLLDQVIAFKEGKITTTSIQAVLGLTSKETYFELDRAGKEGNLAKAFEIAHEVFAQGKDLIHFVEGLIEHYRILLLIQLSVKGDHLFNVSPLEREKYEASARLYTQEQCMTLMDYLIQAQNQIRSASFTKMDLEVILLYVMRSHFRLSIEVLVRRLSELEQRIADHQSPSNPPALTPKVSMTNAPPPPAQSSTPALNSSTIAKPFVQPSMPLASAPVVTERPPPAQSPKASTSKSTLPSSPSMSEDPTPTPADLGIKKTVKAAPAESKKVESTSSSASSASPTPIINLSKPSHYYDTLIHFTAVELEGKAQKNSG